MVGQMRCYQNEIGVDVSPSCDCGADFPNVPHIIQAYRLSKLNETLQDINNSGQRVAR